MAYRSSVDGVINLDALDPAATGLCLSIELSAEHRYDAPELTSWMATYRSDTRPGFSFEVGVVERPDDGDIATDASLNPGWTVDNTVQIATETPEITVDNNIDTHQHALRTTDIAVKKTVDKTAALPGDTLVYTISVKNQGNNPAQISLEEVFGAYHLEPTSIVLSSVTVPPAATPLDSRKNAYIINTDADAHVCETDADGDV